MRSLTVALIGPDGAGKTTVGRRLEQTLPVPAKYLYMGWNVGASNVLLPTSRIVYLMRRIRKARHREAQDVCGGKGGTSRRHLSRFLRGGRSVVGLAHRLTEEWFRQLCAWYHLWRGRVVIFDRHFRTDYVVNASATDYSGQSTLRQIHAFVLNRIYPRPDLVILLDAPAEVLWERKRECTVEALERRRQEYLELGRTIKHFVAIDATQPLEAVVAEVGRLILYCCHARDANE